MPTHFCHYRETLRDEGDVFHMGAASAYRLRNALLAAGAIDPGDAEPRTRVHFLELYEEGPGCHHVLPVDILATVKLWKRRIPGVRVYEGKGLSEGERTQLVSTIRRPDHDRVVALALPVIDGDELADVFVDWAETAADSGGFVVLP